jgi:hypothetical protein
VNCHSALCKRDFARVLYKSLKCTYLYHRSGSTLCSSFIRKRKCDNIQLSSRAKHKHGADAEDFKSLP